MRFEKKVEILRIKKYKGKESKEFLDDVIKMARGEPLEYILGELDFCNVKIDLSLRPMIPRPETEFWVAMAITKKQEASSKEQEHVIPAQAGIQNLDSRLCGNDNTFRVLDLFSGSGNVGIAFLKNIPKCTVDMIEYDPKLKEQIEISINKNKIDITRATIIIGDTFEPLSRQGLGKESRPCLGKYDVITAVPPYVPPQMKDEVMKELSAESPLSFFDKEDGYYYHKQVLYKAKEFLFDGGTLYLEFDITQREKIEELAREFGWENYSFLTDPYGHEFVIKLIK
jgi:release factor glutamine methyltransferase